MASPPPPRGGLSLYENLLDPKDSASATISSAPVVYNQTDPSSSETAAKNPIDSALRFQPIRRPQVKQPVKAKPTFPKAIPKPATAPTASIPSPAPPKTTLADWAATEDDDWMYDTGEKRPRGGRKKKKKQQRAQLETNWDDIYDLSRPTNVEEYLQSEEKVKEVREWKALLYRHRKRHDESVLSDDEEDARPAMSNQFAPPPSYAAVPPPPKSPPAAPPPDETAEEAYARRLALAQGLPVPSTSQQPPPPPPPAARDPATISAAPVRYTQPTQSNGDEDDENYSPPPTIGQPSANAPPDAEERSTRPGQAGFAHRLMSKYGWTKGSGLGADESGIINPLHVQVEKRRKRADADGGGWAEPAGKGKILGGKRKEEPSQFGTTSEVIVLENMLENMPDLQSEIADGLAQEIGEECGEKYGRVERLYIEQQSRRVFIKFTNQVSALRAVNELDGRVFNGNTIVPKFFDTDKFEKEVYT